MAVVSGPDPAHTALLVGFEDQSFRGTVTFDANHQPASISDGVTFPTNLDYNDTVLSVAFTYPPVQIAPGDWSPLTAIDNALAGGNGSIAQVAFAVSGLGGGVSLGDLGAALSAGWTLGASGTDAAGNGSYMLEPPGGAASSAAFVAELAKLAIHVDGATSPGHDAVTIAFTATDTAGLSDSARSTLSFADGGSAPPASPQVHVDSGPLAPPSPIVEPLLTHPQT